MSYVNNIKICHDNVEKVANMTDDKVFFEAFEKADIKETTRRAYLANLRSIAKYCNGTRLSDIVADSTRYFPMICEGAKGAKRVIREGRDEMGSVLTLVKTVLSLFKYVAELNGNQEKNKWTIIFKNLDKKQLEKADNNVARSHNMTWNEIMAKYEQTKLGTAENMVLAIYCEIPPRRQEDYWKLALGKDIENSTGYVDLKSKNKYILINNYKTVAKYGEWKKELPLKLVLAIREYLKGKSQKYLFCKIDGKPYSSLSSFTGANNIVIKNALGNPHASVNTIRHAFASFVSYNQEMTIAQKKIIALDMGHSIEMQLKYGIVG